MSELRLFQLTKALDQEYTNNTKMMSSIIRTKDPTIAALEKDVLSRLSALSVDNTPTPSTTKRQLPCDNKVLSPEEAIKELQEMEAKGII